MGKVIVIGELSKGELASHTFELATLAQNLNGEVAVVISAKDNADSAGLSSALGAYGVAQLHLVNPGTGLSGAALANYIAPLLADGDVVLGPQTYLGRDVVSQLSVLTDKSVLSNATNVSLEDGVIVSEHPVFGGTQIVKAKLNSSPYLALVRPKSIAAQEGNTATCEVISADASALIDSQELTEIISSEVNESDGPELEDATVVVSGGRGLGSKENYESLVCGLAKTLNGAFGASRAIVDAGWVPYSCQVGQTGKTVKPDVYIACGISGATQHLVGMKGSKKIIAINTDEQAPIFSVADLGIVGDVNVILPALIEKLKTR